MKSVRAALEFEPGVNLHRFPIHMELSDDGVLTLAGETENIAAKKRALEIAGATPGIRGVVDRLRVMPAERRGDGAILDSASGLLLSSRELQNATLRVLKKGRVSTLREIADDNASGTFTVSAADGVITLDGQVISLSHKRLAGVLAWWTPGCRDVVNGLEVAPPEQDSDDEVSDALRLVFEADPILPHAEQIRILASNYVVTLEGVVPSAAEQARAEEDAWCLFAVDKVINHLEVGA